MSTCPFCGASIDDELAVHGGTCPSCLAEIPGEEAATDPGEEVKAQQDAEDRERAQRRAMLPLYAAAPVVLLAVGAAVWALWPTDAIEPLEMDDGFVFEINLEEAPEDAVAEAPTDDAAPGGERTARPPRPKAPQAPDAEALAERLAAAEKSEGAGSSGGRARTPSGSPRPAGARPADDDGVASVEPATSGLGLDVAFQARRTGALLTEPGDVRAAVKDLLRSRSGKLRACYERTLKAREDLAGVWKIGFRIEEDGAVSRPTAEGQQAADDGFEACLRDEIETWTLPHTFERPWPMAFPLTFKPS